MKKGIYANSPYGKMGDRIKERAEAKKKKIKSRIPYKYLMSIYA